MDKAQFKLDFTKTKERNAREVEINKFLVRINPDRILKGYRELQYPAMASMFQKIPTDDLYAFYRECEKAKNFSAFFWWKMKQK